MPTWLLITLVVAQAPAAEPSLGTARALVAQLRSGEVSAAWAQRSPTLTRQFANEAQLRRFAAGLRRYGAEARVVSEGLAPDGDLTVYRRVMAVANWARGLELELTLDARGRLARAALHPASTPAPTPYAAYRVKTALRVPLTEEWYVLWGGRTWEENKHSAVSDMRFALDLLQPRRGQGQRNEDYPAWGQPVVAPADGVVVEARDGIADNPPNRPVGGNLYGNMVVVDHGNGEFSLLGHLKKGSLAVRAGQRVARGDLLARVGSSGMSTEPHLHYQLMDGPDWRTAHGLPVLFTDLRRNGAVADRAEPRRGDSIAPLVREATR